MSVKVTAQDIYIAENFGVLQGLSRHLDQPREHIAQAALQIMETLFSHGYVEKVRYFVHLYGHDLYQGLGDTAMRAEFAIRVGKMGDKRLKALWCTEGVRLLTYEDVAERCSKVAIRELATVFAEVGNLERTLLYLNMGEATRDHFNEAATCFFAEGNFPHGLMVLNQSPAVLGDRPFQSYTSCDFAELVGYALKNKGILGDKEYQTALTSTLTDTRRHYIVLDALCFLGHVAEAERYASQLSINWSSIYPMLSIFKHMPNRGLYFNKMVDVAIWLERKREEKCFGYYELSNLAKSKDITHTEAMLVCYSIPKHSIRLGNLWERVCGITLKWDKDRHDLDDLKMLLRTMRTHASQMPFSDWDGHPPFWVSILRDQIEYGFLEEALITCSEWNRWGTIRGFDKDGEVYTFSDLWFLSYSIPLLVLVGRIEEAKNAYEFAYYIQHELQKNRPHYDNFSHLLIFGVAAAKKSSIAANFDASKLQETLRSINPKLKQIEPIAEEPTLALIANSVSNIAKTWLSTYKFW